MSQAHTVRTLTSADFEDVSELYCELVDEVPAEAWRSQFLKILAFQDTRHHRRVLRGDTGLDHTANPKCTQIASSINSMSPFEIVPSWLFNRLLSAAMIWSAMALLV